MMPTRTTCPACDATDTRFAWVEFLTSTVGLDRVPDERAGYPGFPVGEDASDLNFMSNHHRESSGNFGLCLACKAWFDIGSASRDDLRDFLERKFYPVISEPEGLVLWDARWGDARHTDWYVEEMMLQCGPPLAEAAEWVDAMDEMGACDDSAHSEHLYSTFGDTDASDEHGVLAIGDHPRTNLARWWDGPSADAR